MAAGENLYPVNVLGDSACLYRAMCTSDNGDDSSHTYLRSIVIVYMRENFAKFIQFGALDPDESLPIDKYLDNIARPL